MFSVSTMLQYHYLVSYVSPVGLHRIVSDFSADLVPAVMRQFLLVFKVSRF